MKGATIRHSSQFGGHTNYSDRSVDPEVGMGHKQFELRQVNNIAQLPDAMIALTFHLDFGLLSLDLGSFALFPF
jgi:hypothetical protein